MSPENKHILAVDLGTSGPKVALVTTTGRVLASVTEETELLTGAGGKVEQDPEDWWRAIRRGVDKLLARKTVPVDSIAAVSCTAQWSGTVALDADGKLLGNAITWMDSRGAPQIESLIGGFPEFSGYNLARLARWVWLTGGAPSRSGKDSLAHILYLKHEQPELYEAAATFLEPKDYLNFRLTGRRAATVDSITLHWVTDNRDIDHIRYDEGLLRLAGIDRGKLPELASSVDMLGTLLPEVAEELGLPARVQVVGGSPDVHSAGVGSGAVDDFDAHLYVGTSSWLTCHVPWKKTDLRHNMAALPSAIPGRYMLFNEQETAGECIRYLMRNLFYADDAIADMPPPEDALQRLNAAAESVPPGADGLIFTPWLAGERTPVDDHAVRGGFYNLGLAHTRSHLVRAVLEGVAFNARWLLQAVERFCGRRMQVINFIGGGAQSDLWCQVFADVFDRPVRRLEQPVEANARGAALLAAVALGDASFERIPDCVAYDATFEPEAGNRALYDRLFGEFTAIYYNNRKMFARLNAKH